MNQPGGSQAREERICRRSEATGSCISKVEVRPRNATGTASAAAAAGVMMVLCAGVAIGVPP